jgi:hypothetical protein
MTTPASNPSRYKSKWMFAAFVILFLVPVLLFALIIWGAGAIPSVFGGRYAYRPSPNRDGNVIAELKYANGPNQTDIKKWTLSIPHKYVDKIIGDLDNIGNDELASLTLNGLLEISGEKTFFSPTKKRYSRDSLYINVDNNRSLGVFESRTNCISSAKIDDLNKSELNQICDTPNCPVYDNIDGWNVRYSANKDLISDATRFCQIMRDFLNTHTLQRDVIPNRGTN